MEPQALSWLSTCACQPAPGRHCHLGLLAGAFGYAQPAAAGKYNELRLSCLLRLLLLLPPVSLPE
jgi:hypothetical protein